MPRPARPWFRFHSETLDNAKAFNLAKERPDLFSSWVLLLCLANVTKPRGYLPADVTDIAFALRESPQKTAEIVSELQHHHLIDVKGKRLYMHRWSDWNPDSDANLTPGRKTRAHGTGKERGRNAKLPPKERIEESREEKDKEEDKEKDKEQIQIAHAPESFPEDDDSSFTSVYRRNHEQATGIPINPYRMADAIDLRKKYGDERCIEVAALLGWDKAPRYYIPRLEEKSNDRNAKNQRAAANTGAVRDEKASPFAHLSS